MIFRDYILIKKSSLLLGALALGAAGCLLFRHHQRHCGCVDELRDGMEELRDNAHHAVNKAKRKVKDMVDDAQDA